MVATSEQGARETSPPLPPKRHCFSLSLRPHARFTLAASNVLFGYWSHDIGGHTQPSPAELYTRWVQLGAFSPILRTHCTKEANNDRRIWVRSSQPKALWCS